MRNFSKSIHKNACWRPLASQRPARFRSTAALTVLFALGWNKEWRSRHGRQPKRGLRSAVRPDVTGSTNEPPRLGAHLKLAAIRLGHTRKWDFLACESSSRAESTTTGMFPFFSGRQEAKIVGQVAQLSASPGYMALTPW